MGKKHKGKRGGGGGSGNSGPQTPKTTNPQNITSTANELENPPSLQGKTEQQTTATVEVPPSKPIAVQQSPTHNQAQAKVVAAEELEKENKPEITAPIEQEVKIARAQPENSSECQDEERSGDVIPKDAVPAPKSATKEEANENATSDSTNDKSVGGNTQTLSKRQKKKMRQMQGLVQQENPNTEQTKMLEILPKLEGQSKKDEHIGGMEIKEVLKEEQDRDSTFELSEKHEKAKDDEAKKNEEKDTTVGDTKQDEKSATKGKGNQNKNTLPNAKSIAKVEIEKDKSHSLMTKKNKEGNNKEEINDKNKSLPDQKDGKVQETQVPAKAEIKTEPKKTTKCPEKKDKPVPKKEEPKEESANKNNLSAPKMIEKTQMGQEILEKEARPIIISIPLKDEKTKNTTEITKALSIETDPKPLEETDSKTNKDMTESINNSYKKCPYEHELPKIQSATAPTSANTETKMGQSFAEILKNSSSLEVKETLREPLVPQLIISEQKKSPEVPINAASIQSLPLSTSTPDMSMTGSTSSDMTMAIEESLMNISNVSDDEILKMFDIVSKDFEKTPETTKPVETAPKPDPMVQAEAALANLIQVVGKTETKIKESVEETKIKQAKAKNAKKSNQVAQKEEVVTDLLSDAVLVESKKCSATTSKENSPSSRKSKSPSDSKNGLGSDFALSADSTNPQSTADGAKSLLNDVNKAPTTEPSPPQPVNSKVLPNQKNKRSQPPQKVSPTKTKPVIPPRNMAKTKSSQINQKPERKQSPPKENNLKGHEITDDDDDDDEDNDEEYIEYKFSSRKVFLQSTCAICHKPKTLLCPCTMIAYCSEKHRQEDVINHNDYCAAIQEVAKKRGGHVYNNAKILDPNDFRNLRVHTLNICAASLKRPLHPFEKEMLLFPRLCFECKNWKSAELVDCPKCGQVAYCKENPSHLCASHTNWCRTFTLFQKQVVGKRIDHPQMPSVILSKPTQLPANMDALLKSVYPGQPLKDDCLRVVITQLATGPLTALNAIQKCQLPIKESLVIHLIGAELQFEGDNLDKWETFFLHLMPGLNELRVVFVGPELNIENLPVEILSRIRLDVIPSSLMLFIFWNL